MKKLFLTFAVLLFVGLYSTATAQVQSGSYFFDTNTKDYTLHANEGKRSVEMEVQFAQPFDVKPVVILSVTVVDAFKDTKMRYAVETKSVSRDGFVIKALVWGDTQLSAIGGHWIAIAP